MIREDIIRLAEQADIAAHKELGMPGEFHPDWHELRDEKFAALVAADRDALRHRVRELEEAMRLCGIDHASLLRIATAIRGSAP